MKIKKQTLVAQTIYIVNNEYTDSPFSRARRVLITNRHKQPNKIITNNRTKSPQTTEKSQNHLDNSI